jgi:hypothetical protein
MNSQAARSGAAGVPQLAGAPADARSKTGHDQLTPLFRAGEPKADRKVGLAAGRTGYVNIINPEVVDKFVEGFAGRVRRPEAQQWCRRNLRKYLLGEARLARPIGESEIAALLSKEGRDELQGWVCEALKAGGSLHWFTPEVESWDGETDFIQALCCVVEWIEALPETDRHWRQFFKIGVPEAIAAARAWQRRLARESEKDLPEDWSGVRTMMRFEDGVKFVNLTSRAALEREGHLMSHCVAAYGDPVERGASEIYSLRDTRNRPHVTMEVRSSCVTQQKGKKNSGPGPRWQPYIKAFIDRMGWFYWTPAPRIEQFHFGGRAYTNIAQLIADLPELVDLDNAVFDHRLLTGFFRIIRLVQRGGALAVEHQRAIVAMLRGRIAANRGYRLSPAGTVALELPRSSIVEIAVELAGAPLALAEMGILPDVREEIAALCRQVGRNVLALIRKRPEFLYRLHVSGGVSSVRRFAQLIAMAGLADEFYRVRRAALEHKRRQVSTAVIDLRHRLGERRNGSVIADAERARAIRLIQVQASRFCNVQLHDALVA